MRIKGRRHSCWPVVILLLALTALLKMSGLVEAGATTDSVLSTNDDFINGLRSNVDLSDPKAVFGFVFARLNKKVTVYPTENYYYFDFVAQGKVIKGNIGLFADTRDQGELNFAYEEASDDEQLEEKVVKEVSLFAEDGVELRKLSDFCYAVTFHGKTVVFKLNQIEQKLPDRIQLVQDEVLVGHSFDESGLKFFLVFNQKFNHLFWVLDDDATMADTLTARTDEILVASRTAFAFYDDKRNCRRILIGVSDSAVRSNSWYDGPFDQLPDNYVATGRIELRKYLEAAYPYARGKIDKYGVSLGNRENRVAITTYLRYHDSGELKELVREAEKVGRLTSRFYCEITGL